MKTARESEKEREACHQLTLQLFGNFLVRIEPALQKGEGEEEQNERANE